MMDNITSFIIENKTWLLIVLAVGGSIWGMNASQSEKMYEQRRLREAPTDRLLEFKVGVVLSTLLVVGLLGGLLFGGFKLCAASQTNITLLPAVLLGVALLIVCKIIFQYGVHVFKLCTWSIPSQRKIDLHQKGIDYFHEGDYENAMKCFLSSCKFHGIGLFAGWATSECYIGRMFFEGKGVNKDYETAVKWFRKATELLCFGPGLKISDPNACEWLGYCYEHGYGVEEDSDVALHWYREAADIYKKDEDERFEDVKKRWEELSGESYDESKTDAEEDDAEADDDDDAVDEDEEEFDDTEEESDEEEDYAEDDDGGDNEDCEESDEEDDEDYVDPMDELNAMIGLESVKKQVAELKDVMAYQEKCREKGLPTEALSYHCVLTGNPGTGKTVVARILARIFYDMGIIKSRKPVETDRSGLVAEFQGGSALKTNRIINSALDGVLFIDEAYTLVKGDDDNYGREAVDTLLKRMEDDRDRLVVIVAGYTNEMRRFMDSNPGLKRRFARTIEFPDYNADELAEIFFSFAKGSGKICPSDTKDAVLSVAHDLLRFKDKNFGNAGTVRNLYQETVMRMAQRLARKRKNSKKALQTILPEDLPPRTVGSQKNVDAILDEIDGMIGLAPVKEELRRLVASVRAQKAREKAGIKSSDASYHCVFTGSPGTGKTRIAREMAKIYHALGILATDKVVETDRSKLVAEYVGQTAVKTNDVIDSALDGVLFIDEAYTLAPQYKEDFGQEAIDTLLKRMEDDRNRLVVIVAGYTDDMKRFIGANSGLKSRFTRYIDFPDYSAEELLKMFKKAISKNPYICSTDAEAEFLDWMKDAVSKQEKGFGNGRFVRNCVERIVEQQGLRLDKIAKPTHKQWKELTIADVKAARRLVKA